MASSDEINRKKKRDRAVHARIKNMSKEEKAAAISRKKECNARAMSIVERMLEPNMEHLWLLENLKHINQSHFQDIVEERAITRCCGYPLCDRELTDVPKKIYNISTKENKVYDITDRKNYCSNICYKASTYLKDQLYTSPLWLRDCEIPVEYKLLTGSIERKSSSAKIAGAEIDLGNTYPVKLNKNSNAKEKTSKESLSAENPENSNILKQKSPQSEDMPVIKYTDAFVTQKNNDHISPKTVEKNVQKNLKSIQTFQSSIKGGIKSTAIDDEKSKLNSSSEVSFTPGIYEPKMEKNVWNDSNNHISGDSSEINVINDSENPKTFKENLSTSSLPYIETEQHLKFKSKSCDKSLIKGSDCNMEDKLEQINIKIRDSKEKCCTKNNESPMTHVVREIEERVVSWFTLESMVFLLGHEQLRALLELSRFKEDIPLSRYSKKEDYEMYLKCQKIYKMLNMLELKDTEDKQIPCNPIPDYKQLHREAEDFELKVKTFFQGGPKVTFAPTENINENPEYSTENGDEPALPLIDHHAILATRQRIFLDKLNNILPDMLSALELSQFRFGLKLADLVATFNLEAKNILFRPAEWDLVAIMLIKLLTIPNHIPKLAYTKELTQRRLMAYLLTYDLDAGYLDRFTSYVVNIERIVNTIQPK